MKIKTLFVSLVLLATGGSLSAQLSPAPSSTGNITTNAANCNTTNACIVLHMATSNVGYSVSVSGSWTGTLTVEQSGDNQATWSTATTTTANTLYTSALLPGITDARVRSSAAMTGTAVVTITASGPATIQNVTASSSGSSSTPGVFTVAQQNDAFSWTTNPGLTAGAILNFNGVQTYKLTDGIASIINIPTSGVTNAFTNNFAAYCWNPNGNATGQFGWVGCVGYFSQAVAAASGARVWGANIGAADLGSQTGNFVYGNEYDLQINNATTQGAGTLYSFRGNGQPTADNFPAVTIQAPQGTAHFTSGYRCEDGATLLGSTYAYQCIGVGQQATGNAQDSQRVWFHGHAGATAIDVTTGLVQDNFQLWQNSNGMQTIMDGNAVTGGFPAAYGIAMKATATLSFGQLVKPDTGNAGSVVVCTTADTVKCIGFVAGGSVYCAAGGIHCGIITVPGSRAVGVVGTGTCAIGDNVIVDTTTNGRVKCQVGIPAQGAWIGVALTAQGSVGGNVDILFKGQ